MVKVVAKKSLGQNFLTDQTIANLMAESLEVRSGDQVIEIGSGTGVVTKFLAQLCRDQGAYLTAVEFDIDLIPVLEAAVTSDDHVKIVNANILNYLEDLKPAKDVPIKFVGSLPYNITSPLIHRIIKNQPLPKTCVFLIQKEVAQKICETAPDSNYLSVFVQTFYKTEILKVVDKNLFDPIPQIDGAVIKLEQKEEIPYGFNIDHYVKFLHRIFAHPRKMLNKVLTKKELEIAGFEGNKRPQDYTSSDYLTAYYNLL